MAHAKLENLKVMVVVFLLVLAGSASAELTSHLEFEDNLNDSAGGDNSGIFYGGSESYVAGPNPGTALITSKDFGKAVSLDGTDDYVTLAGEADFDITGAITVAFWIKCTFNGNWMGMANKGYSVWMICRNSSTNNLYLTFKGLSGNPICYGSTNVNDNQWHHVAGVYDPAAGKMFLYVDGKEDDSVATSGGMVTNDYAVTVVGAPSKSTPIHNIRLNHLLVRIYDFPFRNAELLLN